MDSGRRLLAGAVIRLLEERGETKLWEVSKFFEDEWPKEEFAEHALGIYEIWHQRQQLKALENGSHVSRPLSPALLPFVPYAKSDKSYYSKRGFSRCQSYILIARSTSWQPRRFTEDT